MTKTISRTAALRLMMNAKGQFFTVVFTKKDGSDRTINCQYLKDQKELQIGYVKVKDLAKMKTSKDCIRNVNLQTLKSMNIGGKTYKVR